jgi:hypothetical protein
MPYNNQFLLLVLIFLITGCSTAPTSAPTPISVTETLPASPQPTTVPAATENTPALKAGQWTYIFYHDGLEQVVLVNGGPERGKPADEPLELWGWDGSQWSQIGSDAAGPTWRNWAAVAYDTARDVLVIHGGLQPGKNFDETWEWDGQTWKLFTGPGPGAREGALMAYDAARSNMILFGGSSPDFKIHGDTWQWNGQTWTQVSETGPAERFPGAMGYDVAREQMLLYSGHFASTTGEFTDFDDLWSWDGDSWHEIEVAGPTPDHRTHSGFVFDPVTEQVLLVGSGSGTFLPDVWSWDGSKWEEIPTSNTPARSGHNIAYDPARDRFVLFGGVDRPGGTALDDTWEWDRTKWVCVNNCQ